MNLRPLRPELHATHANRPGEHPSPVPPGHVQALPAHPLLYFPACTPAPSWCAGSGSRGVPHPATPTRAHARGAGWLQEQRTRLRRTPRRATPPGLGRRQRGPRTRLRQDRARPPRVGTRWALHAEVTPPAFEVPAPPAHHELPDRLVRERDPLPDAGGRHSRMALAPSPDLAGLDARPPQLALHRSTVSHCVTCG